MQVVADRYMRIAAYYSERADNEDTDEGDAKLIDAGPQLASQERDVTNGDRLRRVAQEIDRLDERDPNLRQHVLKPPLGNRPKRASVCNHAG
jgi:hypothetical protein